MQSCDYTMTLIGREIPCSFRFAETASLFGPWITGPAKGNERFSVPQEDWDFWPTTGKPTDAEAEFSMFSAAASTALLSRKCCVVHAAAFRYRDRAWLIAGAPGVGKSTQIRNLLELRPGEFSVISGDRPILEAREDGSVTVHPSPWNGKEGWHGAEAAPLAGVIFLQRGEKNSVAPCSVPDAVIPLFTSLFHSGETEEILKLAASMATAVLTAAPAWNMTTFCVPDSTHLLYDTLFTEEEAPHDL